MSNNYDDLAEEYGDKGTDYYQQSRPEMLQFIPEDTKRVLDIGCSSGGFGKLLKSERAEIEVWGIEPDQTAAAIASDGLDKIICRTFEKGMDELESQDFDCIVFNDVLEHIVDPFGTLTSVKYLLRPNGYVVASIPNILFLSQIAHILIKQDWKYQESGILDYTHLRFFTRKSIIRMFEQSGFEIVRVEGINPDRRWVARLFNLVTLGLLRDWQYMQFGICVRIGRNNG